ncbi:MAG: cobalamin B12-binding domain-containing protein [Acidobacteria bacterium]|nr:cobalamin B12-binding domain-containing protein [Acidobacteriota bacterium]
MKALVIYPVIEDDRGGRAPLPFRAANMVTSYLAALFPPDVEVDVLDEYVEPMRYDLDADLIALSVLTPTAHYSYEIADRLRRQGHTVIAGGIHPSVFLEEAAQHFDAVVIGEGEEVIPELVRDFQAGRLKKIYRAPRLANLDNIPAPRWDLLKAAVCHEVIPGDNPAKENMDFADRLQRDSERRAAQGRQKERLRRLFHRHRKHFRRQFGGCAQVPQYSGEVPGGDQETPRPWALARGRDDRGV